MTTQPDSTAPATLQVVESRPSAPRVTMGEMQQMAGALVGSGLFGIKTPAQALALMLVAQAEGRHPATVAHDYHIIQGRPTLTADAMLGRFQAAGGSVKWHDLTVEIADATFYHPSVPDGVRISWTSQDAIRAGLAGKDNWKKYPRAMLRSRCVAEGVRTCFPGCLGAGHYTPEEIASVEFEDVTDAREAEVGRAASMAPNDLREKALEYMTRRLHEEFGDGHLTERNAAGSCGLSVVKDLVGVGKLAALEELEPGQLVALCAGKLRSPFEMTLAACVRGERRPEGVTEEEWFDRLKVQDDERREAADG